MGSGKSRPLFFRQCASTLVGGLIVACCSCPPAVAGSYLVTNTNDSGTGSLRQAIINLNAAGDAANSIQFDTKGTITLQSLLDQVNEDVTFVGGSGVTILLPSVGTGSSLDGLYIGGGGGISFNGVIPNVDVTGTGGGLVGAGGDVVEFNSDISGSVRVEAGVDEVYALGSNLLRVSDISGTVTGVAGRNEAVGLWGTVMLDVTGTISGTIMATAGNDSAAGLNSPDIDIAGDISGTINAHAGNDEAYGITADEFDLQGDMSGLILSTAEQDGAFGLYISDELIVRGDVSGAIRATAGGHTAIGLFSDFGTINGGNTATSLDISGSVSATANGLAVGIASWGPMNVNISGIVRAEDTSGGGGAYAIRSGQDDMAGGWAGDNNVDDVVQLGSGATITGHIDLGGGTNALGMIGSGSMTGDLDNVTTFDKGLSGYWIVNGHTDVTNMTVSGGKLRLNSSAAGAPTNAVAGTLGVGEGATLEVAVHQSAASSLDVTGVATVDGTVSFIPRTLLAPGTTFTAMNMGGMAGAGSYSAPLFTVDTSSGTSAVLTKIGYSSVQGLSPNAKIMADLLTPLTATATGDLAVVLTGLEGAPTVDEFEHCLEQLTPIVQTGVTSQGFDISGLFSGTAQMHLAEVRSVFTALAQSGMDPDDPATWPLLADNGDVSSLGLRLSEERDMAVALQVFGEQGGMADLEAYDGYLYRTFGLLGAVDWLMRDGLVLGMQLAHADTATEYNDEGSRSDVESWSLGGYGSLFGADWSVNGGLSATLLSYEVDRSVGFLGRTAESDFKGYVVSASASGAYGLEGWGLQLSPLWSLDFARFHQSGYTEHSAGAANLSVAPQTHHSLQSGLGLRGALPVEIQDAMIVPEVSVMWTHEHLSRDLTMDTQMAGNPGVDFELFTADQERDALVVGAGAGVWSNNGSSLSLHYQGAFREHSWSHAGTLEYRISF